MWTPGFSSFIEFQDEAEVARVRAIRLADICCREPAHDPEFGIRLVDDLDALYLMFASDIVAEIVMAAEDERPCVLILPCGPVPHYKMAAKMINDRGISCEHLITFNMDEYADKNGVTAPSDWEGSFATAMMKNFFAEIRDDLRPKPENIHFPNTGNIASYSDMIADAGGADCCYGGIGWCGHIAFFESHLHADYPDLDAYLHSPARLVTLNPMTIMQNALHSFGGDPWWVPPMAATIGMGDIMGARRRSFWLDGMCGRGTNMSWQRMIARMATHCYPNKYIPATWLQKALGSVTIWGPVASDVEIDMS